MELGAIAEWQQTLPKCPLCSTPLTGPTWPVDARDGTIDVCSWCWVDFGPMRRTLT